MTENTVAKTFFESAARAIGLASPGVVIATALFYKNQHLSSEENMLILGVAVVWFFILVGLSVFHKMLWDRFGRLALLTFIVYVIVTAMTRSLYLLHKMGQSDLRLYNTYAALILSAILAYFVWWRTLFLPRLKTFLFPKDID